MVRERQGEKVGGEITVIFPFTNCHKSFLQIISNPQCFLLRVQERTPEQSPSLSCNVFANKSRQCLPPSTTGNACPRADLCTSRISRNGSLDQRCTSRYDLVPGAKPFQPHCGLERSVQLTCWCRVAVQHVIAERNVCTRKLSEGMFSFCTNSGCGS